MARTIFSNVPTAGGGVISGNISTSPGSPFGAGGKYEAQVSDIKATIARAPKGFYDPVGWDAFLKKSEGIGLEPTRADDPEIMNALLNIPHARDYHLNLKERVLLVEREMILAEIRRNKGNKSKAAKEMGISREALRKKLLQSDEVLENISADDMKKAA